MSGNPQLGGGVIYQTIPGTQTHEPGRLVISSSPSNSHLHVPTFNMETAESIRKSIRKEEWVTSIDLTDAYFHVPINPQSQKYLRFQKKKGVFSNFKHSFWVSQQLPWSLLAL